MAVNLDSLMKKEMPRDVTFGDTNYLIPLALSLNNQASGVYCMHLSQPSGCKTQVQEHHPPLSHWKH